MSDILATENCPTRSKPFNTPYCPNCGERRLTEKDSSITILVGDALSFLLESDGKLIRSIKTFVLKPGKYVQEYVGGARKKYISPIKLFLIANAFYFFFPVFDTFKTTLNTQLHRLLQSDLTYDFIQAQIATSGMEYEAYQLQYDEVTTVISKAILIILPFLFGGLTLLLNLSSRKIKPLLHHFNYSFTLYAFMIFFGISAVPGLYMLIADLTNSELMIQGITEISTTVYLTLLLNVFGFFLYRNFFSGSKAMNGFKWLLLNFLFIPLMQLYRFILLFFTLGWMKLFN
ncbi:MAG: DUF3667 domain-containing protein [Balneola sp.]|nr:MAG: DUF3667 domain-containing protein [Balneola sp.]